MHVLSLTKNTHEFHETAMFLNLQPKMKRDGLKHFCAASLHHHRSVTAPLSTSAPLSPSEMPVGRLDCRRGGLDAHRNFLTSAQQWPDHNNFHVRII